MEFILTLYYETMLGRLISDAPNASGVPNCILPFADLLGEDVAVRSHQVQGWLKVCYAAADYVRVCHTVVRCDPAKQRDLLDWIGRIEPPLRALDIACQESRQPLMEFLRASTVGGGDVYVRITIAEPNPALTVGRHLNCSLFSLSDNLRGEVIANVSSIFEDCLRILSAIESYSRMTRRDPALASAVLWDAASTVFDHTLPHHIKDMDSSTHGAIANLTDVHNALASPG